MAELIGDELLKSFDIEVEPKKPKKRYWNGHPDGRLEIFDCPEPGCAFDTIDPDLFVSHNATTHTVPVNHPSSIIQVDRFGNELNGPDRVRAVRR